MGTNAILTWRIKSHTKIICFVTGMKYTIYLYRQYRCTKTLIIKTMYTVILEVFLKRKFAVNFRNLLQCCSSEQAMHVKFGRIRCYLSKFFDWLIYNIVYNTTFFGIIIKYYTTHTNYK